MSPPRSIGASAISVRPSRSPPGGCGSAPSTSSWWTGSAFATTRPTGRRPGRPPGQRADAGHPVRVRRRPTGLLPRRESHPAWTLTDLVERYPELRLLLFTDGEALIDPWTGRPASRMEASPRGRSGRPSAAPPASWTSREDRLAEAGSLVEPATPDGLAALASGLAALDAAAPDDPTAPAVEPVPPLPETLRAEPGRWLDPHRPRPRRSSG